MNPLFQKKALDAWLEQINDPDYAIHQHHSDPGYTTQNGKDYAGRNTTENEEGALQDGIPADLLSIELGKTGKTADNDDDFYRELEQEGQQDQELHEQVAPAEYDEALNRALTALDVLAKIPSSQDIQGCAQMTAADLRQFAEEYKAGKARRFSSDADNPSITTMPAAPAPVDPSNATFFKESEPASPFTAAEEKINGIVGGEGFHYGARVTDGTTLWFRGSSERLSFNPKTGNVSYLKDGKVGLECPVDQLQQHIGKMLKSAAREFHETLKKRLGQTAAIRPSPHTVFENKVDNATGKQSIAPTEPSDDEVMQAQKTLENAGVGDQIGVNASETVEIKELGTKMSGFTGGGPFSCMDCVHRTPHSKNAKGEEVDSCKHPDVMADPELADRKLPDGTIEVDANDCCRFVRPTKKESEKEAAVTKTYGTGTPPGGTPNDPSIDDEDADEGKTSSQKRADIGIKETPKHLPPRDDIRRHIDQDVQDEIRDDVMEGVKDASEEGEYYLDKVRDMKAEAKEAFMQDSSMQQEAQDAGMGMEDLWKEIGGEFTENYYISAYSKQGSIAVEEGFKCPNCKSMKGKAVE